MKLGLFLVGFGSIVTVVFWTFPVGAMIEDPLHAIPYNITRWLFLGLLPLLYGIRRIREARRS